MTLLGDRRQGGREVSESSWRSYGDIYNLGHRAVESLFVADVVIQEKIDGSQFSFGVFDGKLKIRSKNVEMDPDAPEKMFLAAADTVRNLSGDLQDGWTYRGEYLRVPHHNTLNYERVPKGNIILFDIAKGEEDYLLPIEVANEALSIGLEFVPTFYEGPGNVFTIEHLKTMLERQSVLGGERIEGVVIKAYGIYGRDKKTLMGKHVQESFKERNDATWAKPQRADIIEEIGTALRTDNRWLKAVQHLRDAGQITDSPKDIGPLLHEVQADILKEEAEYINGRLFAHFKKDILSQTVRGLPQWYKERLLAKQFSETKENGA